MLTRFNNLSFKEQLELYDRGRTTAVIYGIDKPKLFYIDGKYVVYFVDIVANTAVSDVDDYTNITTEFFYWTPDLPEITVKQAHLLRKWYDLNPQQRYIIDPKENVTGDLLAHLERSIIVPVIYPSVDHNMFQASKPTQAIFSEHDSWFWDNHMNTQMAQVWEAGVKTLLKTVPNSLRYTPEGKVAGLQLFKSKFYYL
jgi:hypothetical protein